MSADLFIRRKIFIICSRERFIISTNKGKLLSCAKFILGNFVNKVKFCVRRGYDGDVARNKFLVNLVCSNGSNSPKS